MPQSSRIVLCIDDDLDDRELVCFTIGEIDPTLEMAHAEDGVEAIDYLRKAQTEAFLP